MINARHQRLIIKILLPVSLVFIAIIGTVITLASIEYRKLQFNNTNFVAENVSLFVLSREVPLSGMTKKELTNTVIQTSQEASSSIVLNITDYSQNKSYKLTAHELGWSSNTEELIQSAWAHNKSKNIDLFYIFKEWIQPTEAPDLKLYFSSNFNEEYLQKATISTIKTFQVNTTPPRRLLGPGLTPQVIPGEHGWKLNEDGLLEKINTALKDIDVSQNTTTAQLVVKSEKINPVVYRNNAIVICRSSRMLFLWQEGVKTRTYRVAVGAPDTPTPRGDFVVTLLRKNPTWINPAPQGWGSRLPRVVPPGPNNPLGVRAINISIGAIRIHGTPAEHTIGQAVSKGCIRMLRADVIELFEKTEKGMPVYIR